MLWFRRDLRLHDLPAMPSTGGAGVLACFVLDPRLEASSGPRRLQFLGDSLREIDEALGGRLLIARGRPGAVIPEICRAVGAAEVRISADFSPFGLRRDRAVAAELHSVGAELTATGSPHLVSPGRVTKDDGTRYKVFTPFFRRWREVGWRAPAKSDPAGCTWIDPADVVGLPARIGAPDPGVALELPAGERAARERWAEFLAEGASAYSDERNRPDRPGTSRMSAHLKFGTIHPRTMVAGLDLRDAGGAAYLRELAFRDFYAAVLHAWPDSAWNNWNPDFDTIEVDTDGAARKLFEAWKQGRTGFPIVDAGMRQLAETGFMHNRVRMIVASFLVKDLHLPWQWGARWFLEQLVDADIASNQHGWQWCAGTGTDAAPYFRVFNPTAQGEKFDPAGDYVRRWVPELTGVDDVHRFTSGRPPTYPEPIVDHAAERTEALRRYGLISRDR
ncbi:MAG: deoxyribodipyrimidine photo-lyase [Mycobacterium sp.]|nr:deoxyribodipyrimidine photo-lyase [Mycobacterium sp.]